MQVPAYQGRQSVRSTECAPAKSFELNFFCLTRRWAKAAVKTAGAGPGRGVAVFQRIQAGVNPRPILVRMGCPRRRPCSVAPVRARIWPLRHHLIARSTPTASQAAQSGTDREPCRRPVASGVEDYDGATCSAWKFTGRTTWRRPSLHHARADRTRADGTDRGCRRQQHAALRWAAGSCRP